MTETEALEGEVVDSSPDDAALAMGVAVASPDDMLSTADLKALEHAGHIVPVALPQQLRRASALKQRVYAAILDERDYMYTVSYKSSDRGKEFTRQYLTMSRAEAAERAETLGGTVAARPKKSGIVKLARALGIVCKPLAREERSVRGIQGFFVIYEASHAATGLREQGVGWCDPSERRGSMSVHDMIATADTRAYNRAVLRLAGFGDISADEVIAGASADSEPLPDYVPEAAPSKPLAALPPPNDDRVLTASRIWAESIVARDRDDDRFAAEAQQDTLAARELRARARRGDENAAQKMGALGVRWQGAAQDGRGQSVFDVEAAPVKPEDIKTGQSALVEEQSKTNGEKKGWDLSSKGSEKDDATATAAAAPASPKSEGAPSTGGTIPTPSPKAETITTGQAKKVSKLLLDAFNNDKTRARGWLKTEAHVDGSVHLRTNQYDAVMSALQKKKETS